MNYSKKNSLNKASTKAKEVKTFKKSENNELGMVSISSSFLHKTLCRFCHKAPSIYYNARGMSLKYERRKNNEFMYFRQNSFVWPDADCIDFLFVSNMRFKIRFFKTDTRFFRNKGLSSSNNFIEYLSCNCGKSVWLFSEIAGNAKPEVSNRKSKTKFRF